MKQTLKNIGIVILGLIIGMIVNIGLIIIGGTIFPLPENIEPMNKATIRMNLFVQLNKAGDRDEAERYLYEGLNLLNPENPSHKRIYFSSLYMFYSFLSEKGYPYDAIKGYLKLLNDVEKEFPKSGLIGEILFLLSSLKLERTTISFPLTPSLCSLLIIFSNL